MTTAIIETHDLKKQFEKATVLNGIDLTIEAGQVVGLLGTNGLGKTTLLKCLLGLLRPTSGTSAVFGETSWDLSASSKSRLGYVSQEFALLPWMNVRSMTEYTGAFYEQWDQPYVDLLLKEWTLDEKARVATLSVGQRQKLAVILALGHHPELLILDEPVASLDPVARRQFLKSLIEFTEHEENTILF
ncbi:ABC transporter ATP-binding protein [Planctomycetaceae bacterium]|nr:ABC transporter ATP-binding protein [Planctomycetaceae bacterium]